jgi:NRAMP (natural resistance-associated macrophage protein)-like metal ion transporter
VDRDIHCPGFVSIFSMVGSIEKKPVSWLKRVWRSIGPGFITGAADDDPSGIATYSQVGASFGYSQLWVVLFSYPLMTVIQEMCGRVGLVTGKGLAAVIKEQYSRKLLYLSVGLLVVANTINIGADLGAMAASLGLLVPVPFVVLLLLITAGTLFLEIYIPYASYVKFLKYLTLSLLAYVGTALLVVSDWSSVFRALVVPHIVFSREYLFTIAALLGTTISPYLFFWQTGEEIEEEIASGKMESMESSPAQVKPSDLSHMIVDTGLGMFFSQLVAFFIVTSVAATLGVYGVRTISTAADAALALQPIAGKFAFLLFALGIIGTGLLAVPILAGSAGFAVAEAFGWKEGLDKKFSDAKYFYMIIAAATIIGLLVNLLNIGAMSMLFYAAMFNGVLAPPLMIVVLLVANNKNIMGTHTNGLFSNIAGIIITVAMSMVAVGLFLTLV